MKIANKNNNRLAIYVYQDNAGIVDQYALYFLKELKKCVSNLVVVVNGSVNNQGYEALKIIADTVLLRANEGYDISAYKYAVEYLGWEEIGKYDEHMFVNSSLFGPFYPFTEMFDTMNQRDIDFWGVTKFHECEYTFRGCKYDYTPEHIQSSFLVIRNSMATNLKYQEVWNELPILENYEDAIALFELPFTKESIEKGFVADVYIDTTDLDGYTRYPLMMMADELVVNRRCPILKQKSFSQWYYDILDESIGITSSIVLDYLKKSEIYDINMIWENILRKNNMSDIKNHLGLNTILPLDYAKPIEKKAKVDTKVALVMHLYYMDQLNDMIEYSKNMPLDTKLVLISPIQEVIDVLTEKCADSQDEYVIVKMPNRGRDVSALLVAAYPHIKDMDVVCFVHDKKSNYIKPYNNGVSFLYQCMHNLLATPEYVTNIINQFKENEKLGMLMPPNPIHGDYYQVISSEWAGNLENTIELAKRLNLRKNIIEPDKAPITPLGTMFWFRPKAMKTLFEYDWSYEDFPEEPNGTDATLLHAIERIYGIVCQNDGYYPAWVMSDFFANKYMNNLYFMLREVNLKMFESFRPRHMYDMINNFDNTVGKGYLLQQKDVHIRNLESEINRVSY